MKTLARALGFLRPYWLLQIPALACALSVTIANLAFPWILKILIDDVFVARSLSSLNFCILALVFVEIFAALFGIGRQYLFTYVGERAIADIRTSLFRHLQTLSMAYHGREKTGRVMSSFTNDVGAMQGLYSSTLVDLITNTFQMVVTMVFLFRVDAGLASVSWPVIPLFGLSIWAFSGPLRQIGAAVQEQMAEVSEHLQEVVAGSREVKAFTQESRQVRRFEGLFLSLLPLRLRQGVTGALSGGVANLAAWGGLAFVLWLGGRRVIAGEMTPGVVVAFVQYLGNLFGPTAWFVSLNIMLQGAVAGADRVFALLDEEPEVRDAPDAVPLSGVRGEVEFHDVSFAYEDGETVLHDIRFRARPGEMIALVGASGSGKTTLTGLICRFHDPTKGKVTIDGRDLREVTQESLRNHVGIVFQETFLFGTSVRENLRFGRPDATDEEIETAARMANAHGFIAGLPRGYDTLVGERGTKLSGGQRQRIAIARAILRDPRILILDEATSSLDSESEAAIQAALEGLMRGRTSFVVAHRLSTILRADRILVLERGRLVESGTHAELLRGDGVYRRLHDAQFQPVVEEIAGVA